MVVGAIVNDLIDHGGGLCQGASRQASHCDIDASTRDVGTLAIVEQTKVIVGDVAVELTEGVITLVAEQVVVGRLIAPIAGEHAVVPCAIAKEEQIAGLVGSGLGTIVEHLHITAIGIGIGSAAGELVIKLVGRHDVYSKTIVGFVEGLQA